MAVLHDIELVKREFPETLLLAREGHRLGPDRRRSRAENRLRARMMSEAWMDEAEAARATPPDMSFLDLIWAPFVEFGFLRRALVGCLALSLAAPPLGVFLMLRRMSLTADVLAHGILPGIAAGFLVAGLWSPPCPSAG
jgi:hypothetical protein